MICGPTASGKSALADLAAEQLTESYAQHIPVLVVDSMQVYKELRIITNQERRREAELTGVVSVSEEWTMARHRRAADKLTQGLKTPFILDAGTGMYLNAIILDIQISPRVPEELRHRATAMSTKATNPRHAAREIELRLAGTPRRGSIWSGDLRYDLEVLYLRPDKEKLDAAIAERSAKISRRGVEEAAALVEKYPQGIPNPSVRESIGVRELTEYVKGRMAFEEAERDIRVRTRRLARRQMRWFDKLASKLKDRTEISVSDTTSDAERALQKHLNKLQA